MAFNLAEAAGLGKLVSNLDTMEIRQLPISLLDDNAENYFRVEDVQELKDSLALRGILQPLLVVQTDDRYRVIAGHRRKKAAAELLAEGNRSFGHVPCIVLPEMSDAMEQLLLIQTNTTARELSYPEKMESVRRMKATLMKLRDEGVQIPGKLRDIVAEQLEISRTEQARMQVIERNLIPEARELLDAGTINPSVAYAAAKAAPEIQLEMVRKGVIHKVANVVDDYAAARAYDWVERDCPVPDGWWQHEEKRKGNQLLCPAWKNIERHKAKGHPEDCPGCCAKCVKYQNGYCCPDVCPNVKAQKRMQQAEIARQKQNADIEARKQAAKEHFKTTPFANIGKVLQPLVEDGGMSPDDIAEAWALCLGDLDGEYASDFDGGHVSRMIYPEVLDDVNYDLIAFVAFCNAVGKTPNELLGYAPQVSTVSAGWIRFDETKPPDGARVVVRRICAGLDLVGEYLYRGGKWYNPALDDFEMNVTNVTHWILAPEV